MSFILRSIIIFISLLSFCSAQDALFNQDEQNWIEKNPTVKIVMINRFSPFSFEDNGIQKGFTVEFLDKMSNISGLKFEIESSDWSIILNKFKIGEADMISEISHTKEREAFTLFTDPYYNVPTFVFGLKNDDHYLNNKSLIGKRVGISKDIFYTKQLKKLGIKTVEYISSFEKAKALALGEIDYFLASYSSGIRSISEQSITSIKVIDEFYDIKKEDLRFGINKNKPLLHSIIEKSMNSIPKEDIVALSNKWVIFNNDNPKELLNLTEQEKQYLKDKHTITYSEVNWKPLSIIEDNQMKGIMGEFLKLLADRTGIKFKYIPSSNWPDVLEKFKKGEIDMVPGIGSSPQETSLGLVSKNYSEYPMVVVTTDKYKYINKLSELNGKKVAVPKYYTSYNFLQQNYKHIKIVPTENISDALLLVESGKADAFVGHIATSVFYMSQLHLNNLKISGTTDFKFEHKYLVHNDQEILLSIINKAIDSFSQAERSEIYSRWIQTTVTKTDLDYSLVYKFTIAFLAIVAFLVYRHFELKKINEKLIDSKEEIENILENTLEGIMISENFYPTYVNKEALRLFKHKTKSEVLNKKVLDFVASGSVNIVEHNIKTGYNKPYEVELLRSDGSRFPALIRGASIILNNKNLRISSFIDLSDMKDQEKLFLEQSKMAALGEMIGNIAHQWRQPLSMISTSASGLKLKKDFGLLKDEDIDNVCDSIVQSSKYLSQTIDDFKEYIKGNKKLEQFNIKDVLTLNINLLDGVFKTNFINIVYEKQEDITISGYKNELVQAVMNIFNNAKDALLKVDENQRYLFISHYKKGDCAYIEIQDNAGGIEENIIEKIFEPYFTTKHKSQGTGLGLYMTYGIIQGMKGDIEVTNSIKRYKNNNLKGAKFTIKFPL